MSALKQKIMSGMRPTGKLHIGHYMGVLRNWLNFQDEYDCYFCVADWHALTTKYDNTEEFKQNIIDVTLDWLASGIDPEKSTIYLQSLVPQTAELHLYLSMVTPQNWIEKSPTLKDMVKMMRGEGEENKQDASGMVSYGLLGYPVLQTADILTFNASIVPVGTDQLAHLEISRDIARRFNHIYKTGLLNEPKPKLTETPLIMGLDGRKMGKSFNNDIKLAETEEETTKKIMKGITDRARIRKDDPGHPENCEVIFPYYKIFADEDTVKTVEKECKGAERGCADCKRQLACLVNEKFRPLREKRKDFENNIDSVHQIIEKGSEKAREEAQVVLNQVKDTMKMY